MLKLFILLFYFCPLTFIFLTFDHKSEAVLLSLIFERVYNSQKNCTVKCFGSVVGTVNSIGNVESTEFGYSLCNS